MRATLARVGDRLLATMLPRGKAGACVEPVTGVGGTIGRLPVTQPTRA